MNCPKCGAKLKIHYSLTEEEITYRFRICRECGERVYTKVEESLCSMADVVPRINRYAREYYRKKCMRKLQEGAE